jgi:predicted ester cyclase
VFHYLQSALFTLIALSLLMMPGQTARAAQDATPEAECVTTTPEENKALVEAYWAEAVWGPQGKIAEIVAPDEIHHWGIAGTTNGFEEFLERWTLFNTTFPDLQFTVDLLAAQDDLVASLWTATGTHSGEWQGIAATNKEVTWQGINMFRIECGMIAESWGVANHLGLLAQLGSPDVPAFLADAAASEATPMTAASAATPCASDSPDANLALVERWTNDVWTGQNLDVLDEIASPDIIHHGGAFPDAHGVEAVKEGVRSQLAVFPDIKLGIDATITDGDLVVVRWSGTGTNEGEFIGHAPSGEVTDISGINIYRVNCGKIIESWSEINGIGMLRQIQAAEESAAATPAA